MGFFSTGTKVLSFLKSLLQELKQLKPWYIDENWASVYIVNVLLGNVLKGKTQTYGTELIQALTDLNLGVEVSDTILYRGLNQLISSGTITSRWETQEEKQKDPERKGQLRGRPRKIFTLANPLDPDLNEYKEAWKALKKFGKAYQELAKF